MKKRYTILAYSCEDTGSEPGVGYQWSKNIAELKKDYIVTVITKKISKISSLEENHGIKKVGLDLPDSLMFIKKITGVRIYYFIWTFLAFFHLLKNFSTYNEGIVHHTTFTPIFYPPFYFLLPFKFYWGPTGGGESYPLAYYKSMTIKDCIVEILRSTIKYSMYLNPLFYFGCR